MCASEQCENQAVTCEQRRARFCLVKNDIPFAAFAAIALIVPYLSGTNAS